VPEPDPLRGVAVLAARLRDSGVAVGTGQVEAAARALAEVDPADARLALRTVLCSSREDQRRFDELWADAARPPQPAAPPPVAAAALPRIPAGAPRAEAAEEAEVSPAAWSDVEILRARDLAELGDAEREAARRLIVRLAARRGATRLTRRTRGARRRGHRPDLPATLRASFRHGGEPMERRWRVRQRAPRPLVLVLDVSGSMAPYAQMLLLYLQAMVASRRRVEAFAFGTRLTRITHELAGRDAASAVARAGEAVVDWSGGTRIGDALATLNRRHGGRVGRGAVVVILSDGWDRGDPAQLAEEAARLRRVAHRVIWLNPLRARPGYEPLARGMAAALPHVDHFLAGHSIGSLEQLADILEKELT
jgi:uncharacterized protein